MAQDMGKTFPETHKSFPPTEDNVYIPSSDGLPGHCDGDHLAPFSNEEFPNEESGEGKGPGNPY